MRGTLLVLSLFCSLAFIPCHAQQLPTIPNTLTDPAARADYLVRHYWDLFDFSDTATMLQPAVTEQALVNYLDLMRLVTPAVADSSLREMVQRSTADSTVFAYLAELCEKYLYDPDSPQYDETLYIPVLQSQLAAPLLDEASRIRPAYLLDMVMKNRPGQQATDFALTLSDGSSYTLYNIETDYLLLFFYNPDCDHCIEMTRRLRASDLLSGWQADNKLKVLAFYPDADQDLWRSYAPQLPTDWINAYDPDARLFNDELYDLRVMPTLYLLDKNKKVLLKAASFEQLTDFLQQPAR